MPLLSHIRIVRPRLLMRHIARIRLSRSVRAGALLCARLSLLLQVRVVRARRLMRHILAVLRRICRRWTLLLAHQKPRPTG